MTTVVQTTYRPQIAPGVPGMPSDEVPSSDETRQCETVAGIPFGVAVSQGVNDRGCIIGGGKFVGVSVRDVTLDRLPINPLAPDQTYAPVDTYQQSANMAVRSRGRLWVIAQADVSADDPLYYESTGGTLSNSGSGTAASGQVLFTSQPQAGDTVVLGTTGAGNTTSITFQSSGATGNEVNIGPTLGDTLNALVALINASSDANLVKFKALAYPPSPGGAGEGSGASALDLGAATVGSAGNSLTIAVTGSLANSATITNMAGGVAGATAIAGGKWVTSAIAGQIAKISLGIQQ